MQQQKRAKRAKRQLTCLNYSNPLENQTMSIRAETIITAHGKPRQYHRARELQIAASLGTRTAAAYLRNIGFRIEFALAILATTNHPKLVRPL